MSRVPKTGDRVILASGHVYTVVARMAYPLDAFMLRAVSSTARPYREIAAEEWAANATYDLRAGAWRLSAPPQYGLGGFVA